jgi:hypothetical protein
VTELQRCKGLATGLLFALLGVVGSACGSSSYITVRTELHYGEREETEPEVLQVRTRTPANRPERIAIQWPSYCANQTSAAAAGDAVPVQSISSIDCAVEMAELERAFARAGFEVILWDAVRRYATLNKVTAEVAAEKMGVPVLLRVNSIERGAALPGSDARWQREYFQSDRGGGVGRPLTVPDRIASQLDTLAKEVEVDVDQAPRLAVTVDATLEIVPSGEVAWFYRWTHHADRTTKVSERFLVLCSEVNVCRVDTPELDEVERGPRSGSTRAVSVQGRDANLTMAEYAQLTREVLDDLVRRFMESMK